MEILISMPRCIVGRGEECHIRPQSEQVSRKHCVISVDNGSAAVEDCGSANGTFVNGDRIQRRRELKTAIGSRSDRWNSKSGWLPMEPCKQGRASKPCPLLSHYRSTKMGRSHRFAGSRTFIVHLMDTSQEYSRPRNGHPGWLDGKSNGHMQNVASPGAGAPRRGALDGKRGKAPRTTSNDGSVGRSAPSPTALSRNGEGTHARPALTPNHSPSTSQGSHDTDRFAPPVALPRRERATSPRLAAEIVRMFRTRSRREGRATLSRTDFSMQPTGARTSAHHS